MKRVFLVCFYLVFLVVAQAQVRLPRLVSDSMILQRDMPISVWGWASPKEKIEIEFNHKTYTTIAGKDGKWRTQLNPAKAGGPYVMRLSGKNTIILKDILVGDVWFCSGQSNMVHQLKLHSVYYPDEIPDAHYPEIRQFCIPAVANLQNPVDTLPFASWATANPKDVAEFSAVAYFFAKALHQKYHIPIGIINASVGGTPIEAWISRGGLKDFSILQNIIRKNRDTAYVNSVNRKVAVANRMPEQRDKGLENKWFDTKYVPVNWRPINVPGYWEDQGLKDLDGIMWYRKEIDVPPAMVNVDAKLFLGRIVNADIVYINGRQIGNTTYEYPQRRYNIPPNILHEGKNIIVVRVQNNSGKGGFVPDKPYCLFTANDTISLNGTWQYKVGAVFAPGKTFLQNITAQNEPTALYNAMVAPEINYTIKGIVWYQGESNTTHASEYEKLLPVLITDWRNKWNEGNIPFLYVQLPGYGDYSYLPQQSDWATLRNAQLKTLSVPNTGMAVAIDEGEWNDIHPDRKKPIGERLALAAEKIAYGENIVYSGPLYRSSTIEGNKIIISFANIGSGLIFKDSTDISPGADEVESSFAVAGADRKFVWANARIEGDKIIVWNDTVKMPKYVRYAWADDPVDPDLYNRDGLPASPFTNEQ